jgi:hypothetical protein
MSRYILIRRLRGPVFLLLIGSIALLHSTGLLHSFWRWFWPLLFILMGLLLLAERAALASEGGYPVWPNGGAPNSGAIDPHMRTGTGMATGVPSYPGQATAIVPVAPHDFEKDPDGGQS